jgi:hypothetical protein
VSHAQGTRFNLLVFDHAGPEEPVARPVLADAAAILDVLRPNTRTAVDRITDRYPKMAHDQIVAAVAEIANVLDFGVVVVQSPDTEDTCRPDTAMPVRSAPGGPHVSSVGLLFDFDGEHYATTALHAVRDAPGPVWISGVAGTVTVKGPVTDSCLIQLSRRPPSAFSVPFGGVYDGVAPAQWDLARFTRYDQLGEIETQVLGTDMSAFDPDSDGMVRSYTPPVTIPTDSGVALRDLQDRVIGFAHRRSKRQARAQFSSWSWAAQAVTELGITHVWKGGCHGMGLVV